MKMEEPIRLWQRRMGAVVQVLRSAEAKRVLDLGCGEGKLLRVLLEDKSFTEIVGMDVSYRSLEIRSDETVAEDVAHKVCPTSQPLPEMVSAKGMTNFPC